MYSAGYTTSGAARLFFASFIILGTLIFAQLVVGMILSVFVEVLDAGSYRLYALMFPFFYCQDAEVGQHAVYKV